ncbi:SDR family oxidoreductase [Iocasia frigidifontis]|uniref:SDR family oxidoreductase n=1 Tax=Iocasia fonsfrigidae TaxID=2682810 RepID=A0A8A7KIG1_9FIRM|nr:SDR family oxidoreductase [Iocasia fonsfrigidae]QTL99588.1 SDR family oxidoreductase [Iocasia fonsfrigidae]
MDFNLSGKVAIVTGGGGGLGAAISEVLAAEGANVMINYIVDERKVMEFVESLNKKYESKAISLYGNISDENDIDNIFNKANEVYGKVDILVNCAGVWPKAYVKDMEVKDFRRTLKVNLEGPFMLSKKMVNHLIERKSKGKIVNIVSQAAFHGSTSGHAHYAASKGGLVTFTVSLAREVAKYGINVTAVAPGIMRTSMIGDNPEKYIDRIPLKRISEPEEVAYTVAFLASDKADYITGATIDVTGGMLMR